MKCKKCGNTILNSHYFCSNCGNKIKVHPNYVILISIPLTIISFLFFFYNAFIYNNNDIKKSSKIIKNNNENNTISVRNINNNTEILFDNHILVLPINYTYKIISNSLAVLPNDENWYCIINIRKGNFDDLKNNQDLTKKYFVSSGYKVNNFGTIMKENIEWLTFELENKSINFLAGYTTLNSIETVGFVIRTDNNIYNYNLLNNINEIIRNIR